MYGQTSLKDFQYSPPGYGAVTASGASKPLGANVDGVYEFRSAGIFRPYVLAGVGIYSFAVRVEAPVYGVFSDSSVTKFALNGGVGVEVAAGSQTLFIEGRYFSLSSEASTTTFVPIMVGVRFGGR